MMTTTHTTTLDWLNGLYRTTSDGYINIVGFASERPVRSFWAPIPRLDTLLSNTRTHRDSLQLYFGVAPRKQPLDGLARGGDDDCLSIPGLWLDIDVIEGHGKHKQVLLPATLEEAHLILNEFPLPPSSIIYTGGGLQAWWAFDAPLDATPAQALLTKWAHTWTLAFAKHGYRPDGVFDLARIMRLPNTLNHKGEPPIPVTIETADWDRRYTPDDIEQWLTAPEERQRPTTSPATSTDDRAGTDFNQRATWAPLVERFGLQFHHQQGEETFWTHPYKTVKDGYSATTNWNGEDKLKVFTSSIPELQPNAYLTKFAFLTYMQFAGDFAACTRWLIEQGYGTPAAERIDPADLIATLPPATTPVQPTALIDWPTFWATDRTERKWAAEPLLPQGRQIALYAPQKTGKSLLTFDIATAIATGRPILGQPNPNPPTHVLYLDYEMTEDDIEERLTSLEYEPEDDLTHLHYWLHPTLPALNTQQGSDALLNLCQQTAAQVVIIDTFSRAIRGEENDTNTFIDYARTTGLALKREGITVLRTDHAGKDIERGQRGSSAKADDVDLVWQYTVTKDKRQLKLTHSRIGWAPPIVDLTLQTDPLAHHWQKPSPTLRQWPQGTKRVADLLDHIGAPLTISKRAATQLLRDHGHTSRNSVVRAAVDWRQDATRRPIGDIIDTNEVA